MTAALRARGYAVVGDPVERQAQPWSTVWTVPTDRGRVWLKVNCAAHICEPGVHALLAELAPEYVDAPLACESVRGWLLTEDGGTTMLAGDPATRGISLDAVVALVTDYAQLQRRTVGERERLVRAGVPVLDPSAAAELARSQVDELAALPGGDVRRLDEVRQAAVLAALPALAEAGARLATGPVPLALDQCDLWPANVFVPRDGGRYRVFDFADAVWAHPFASMVMLAAECVHRWRVPQPADAMDLRDARVAAVFDAYLAQWSDLGSLVQLRALCADALRIAPLHRTAAWRRNLEAADPEAVARHGQMIWAWLEDATKPVLF